MSDNAAGTPFDSKALLGFTVAAVLIAVVAYASWRFQRWINWKLSYGPNVEERINALEKQMAVASTTNVEWTGLYPAGKQPHWEEKYYGPNDAYIPKAEMGLRGDGVVVWRER